MGRRPGWVLLALAFPVALGTAHAGTACELPPLQDAAKPRTVYQLDESKSSVRFDAKAFLHDFGGKTSKVQGVIRLSDPERLGDAEACIAIDAASLDTGNKDRDDNMRRENLETAKYPTIGFRLAKVESTRRDGGGWEFTALGSLSLHGVSREIRLPIRARQDGDAVRLTATLPLKMSEYQIPIPKLLFIAVEDQVQVSFEVVARLAK
ncbi:MAG TPA: YceI family protein [Candidatus Acidoferrum sp.]|nr:YceI family protein [Candidatus Acidoferrum sp.]